ncbi:PilZ domain-containing protein [Methylobacter sp.]|jgi:c-di-GMP-binding flagellar brake protein YcgR|uniref:PilZ domain-containing protein n=1 Tax=Methylobacter sp. TaxID=2051955 RepID=UPI0025D86DC6|nr:PilZ domain-containing protein [Methylobacter sp.]
MERRLYQRIPVQIPVVVTVEGGAGLKVVAVDVSSDGLGIECDIRQRNMITPGGSYVRNGKPVSVVVDVELSDGDGQSIKIVARCLVAFSRRMSNDLCKIGLRYVDIENSSREWLVRFADRRQASLHKQ